MDLIFVLGKVDGHIRIVHVVVHEIFLDHVALVTQADNEFIVPESGINFHDVPQYGLSANLDHRFRLQVTFLRDPRAAPACKYYYFHIAKITLFIDQ
jgi:hypothetical protein